MKTALYLLPVLAPTVFLLIWAEFRKAQRQIYVFKPLATILVIAAAALSLREARMNPTYTAGVLIGLVLSFGGDVALMFQTNRRAFMIGLALFLLAHIAYAVTFTRLSGLEAIVWPAAVVLLALGVGVYHLFRAGLGTMRVPVIAYMVVISVMVNQAVAAFKSGAFSPVQAWMIAVGAALFYISDVILAANRFWKPFRYNRISLAFYYAGQFLIALAASYC